MVTLKGTITHTDLVWQPGRLGAAAGCSAGRSSRGGSWRGCRGRRPAARLWRNLLEEKHTHTHFRHCHVRIHTHTHASQDIDRLDSQNQTIDIEQYDGDNKSRLQIKCFYDLITFYVLHWVSVLFNAGRCAEEINSRRTSCPSHQTHKH